MCVFIRYTSRTRRAKVYPKSTYNGSLGQRNNVRHIGLSCVPVRAPSTMAFIPMPPTLRPAHDADAPDIHRIINAAFQVENFFKYEDRLTLDDTRHYLASGTFLLAVEEGNTVGCVYVELRGVRAYLGLLAIHPDAQRNGLGSRLLTAAEDHARTAGCHYADIRVVSVRPELLTIYSRTGFVVSGTEPLPPDLRTRIPCHFITMAKTL